jgi:DNA-binding MarR family transcriptional regulator
MGIEQLVREYAARLTDVTKTFEAQLETAAPGEDIAAAGSPNVDYARVAEYVLAQRRSRKAFFSNDLFHEPAWDMLLALYIAQAEDRALFVKTLTSNTDAPATTSQRWIDHLHRLELVDRVVDPHDRRRVEIVLSESGREAMTRYLRTVVPPMYRFTS